MKIKFYWYPNCSTCRKARKALTDAGVSFQEIDITSEPPTAGAMKKWIASGKLELKQLLNTSGQAYRKLGGAAFFQSAAPAEVLKLLATNGRLVKRPVITDGDRVSVGFRDPEQIVTLWT